jgi:hypothetical protein
MNGETKQERRTFFSEGNYTFPSWKPDPGLKRYKEALAKSGLPNNGLELSRMLRAAKTEEERLAISRKMPMTPQTAVLRKKMMGKEEFLAQGFNLDFANEELGGPDWVDRY